MGWEITGDDADVTADMILHMARYLAGPGLAGFIAWVDQEYAGAPCPECGQLHGPRADKIAINLRRLADKIAEVA